MSLLSKETKLLVGGEILEIPEDIQNNFFKGDLVIGIPEFKEVLLLPKREKDLIEKYVLKALNAFNKMNEVSDEQISIFYKLFAENLGEAEIWGNIARANEIDVKNAKEKGRSTTRLEFREGSRNDMIEGLRYWQNCDSERNKIIRTVKNDGFSVSECKCSLGVVAFNFEGRPNVFADAAGVLKMGNTCILRIGSDALNTAKAIMEFALNPALKNSGLPEGSVNLVGSTSHEAAWALFSDKRISLAVARGSGKAVITLGSIAKQNGIPVSLHGTGGGWIIADEDLDLERFKNSIFYSLDRKVCNTVNTICIPVKKAKLLMPVIIEALKKRGDISGYNFKIHTTKKAEEYIPENLFKEKVKMFKKEGEVEDFCAETISENDLGIEWEFEKTPEVTITIINSVKEGISLFNEQSPKFVVSYICNNEKKKESFFRLINSPYISDGFTRWVDGQFIYNAPELGLANWEEGRLFGRSGILTGGSIYSVKLLVKQERDDVRR